MTEPQLDRDAVLAGLQDQIDDLTTAAEQLRASVKELTDRVVALENDRGKHPDPGR